MKKNFIPYLLIVIGITLVATSIGLKIYSKNVESKLIHKFDKEIEDSINRNKNLKSNNKNLKNIEVKFKKVEHGREFAIIEIPSIDLKSVIVQGVNKEELRYYLGHFEDTALPGQEGNFCIAGHSSHIYNELLNELYKVSVGDKIIIKTLKKDFEYKINKKFVVEPSDVNVLKQDKSKKQMTIVTCTNNGAQRLIVQSELKK